MNIGIDIDDTLTYLRDIKIKTVQAHFMENNLQYSLIEKPGVHYLKDLFTWPTEEYEKFWFSKADDMLAKVPAREGASEVLTKLKQLGHNIFIITARTKEVHADPFGMSQDWLQKNNIPYDELLVGHESKVAICQEKQIDVFIDDLPTHVLAVKALGIPTILMAAPHNEEQQHSKEYLVAQNWKEAYELITNLIK